MSSSTETIQKWTLDSFSLNDAYTDFVLSRQAIRCTPKTITFYNFTAGKFVQWLISHSINKPSELQARHVREYLAELVANGRSSMTVNDYARAIRALCRFWFAEKYISEPVSFAMPKVDKKRLPVLTVDEVNRVLSYCNLRDKALVLLIVDTGLRRSEVIALNWSNLDMSSGLLQVIRGKGGKYRSVVVGATVRRQLLKYRRTLANAGDTTPLIQAKGHRFSADGLTNVFRRLSKNSGVYICPHALRRTFVILSLRSGMDVLHLQALLGHSSLSMVMHYAQMEDCDLIQAHDMHSPVDNLAQLK